jgi:hypothetical protein
MSKPISDIWQDRLEEALAGYDLKQLRGIAARLLKVRASIPAPQLIERIREGLQNTPVVDRRLKELPAACRKLLALIGLSGKPFWEIDDLVILLAALGHTEGQEPIQTLFEEGLLYPVGDKNGQSLSRWNRALLGPFPINWTVFAPPHVTDRARNEDLQLPQLPAHPPVRAEVREADGLEWPLRLAAAWQQVAAVPLRQTMQHDFFKRDSVRLRSDPVLNASWVEQLGDVPDVGPLCVEWGRRANLIAQNGLELTAAQFSNAWNDGLFALIRELWTALLQIRDWSPDAGWNADRTGLQPFPSAYLLVMLVLAGQPAENWVRIDDLEDWLLRHHPFWRTGKLRPGNEWFAAMLLGLLFQLRLIQCAPGKESEWLVRLSPIGRSLLGRGKPPAPQPEHRQTLMVQANFEVLAFRQGLTPALIAQLSRFARWKSLGAACILELHAEHVYRGLESGLHLQEIQTLLQQHGMRGVPDNVHDALRTWSNKRDRIVVYSEAALLEFATAADLEAALGRGLVELRLTDRIGLVRQENSVDFRQFRLTATRDYASKPEPCLEIAEDGVTFSADNARSDLLLDLEIARVAEVVDTGPERRHYRFTRAALRRALNNGMTTEALEVWFRQRSGQPLPAAARMLALPEKAAQFRLGPCLILTTPTPELADGLMQWPETRDLIQQRLGPVSLVVAEEHAEALRQQIEALEQNLG